MSIFDKFTNLGKSAIKKVKSGKIAENKDEKKKAEPVEAKEVKRNDKHSTLKLKSEVQPEDNNEVRAKKTKKEGGERAYKILIRPLITEKATTLVGQNKYAFQVANNANKIEIKKAVKDLYGFDPVAINIINERGNKIIYGRVRGKTSKWKRRLLP